MVRRTTHLALVVLAVLVATSPSALVVAGAQGETTASATYYGGAGSPSETVVSSLTDDTTNLTDETTETGETINETGETINETDDAINETTETGETINETDETVNETGETTENVTDTNETDDGTTNATGEITATTGEEVENATDVPTTLDSDASEVTGGTVNATDEVTNLTGSVTNTTDRVESIAALSDTTEGDLTLDTTASSTLLVDVTDAGDALDAERAGGRADSDSRSDWEASDSDARSGDGPTPTDSARSDRREASATSGDSDRSPDRDYPGAPPSGVQAATSVGALTAAALFPHLADGLALVGNVGGLSAASSAAASSRSSSTVRSEPDRPWRFATAFRYSRYDDSDPLAHETRARLHEIVERSPGAYLSAVCERADVAVSTARHHLDVLEDEGLVTTAKVRGKRRYFPAHSDDMELAAAMEDEAAAEVLQALARLGDSHGGRLAGELDRDPSTVSHHLARLEDAGLVEREREGRAVVNRLAPEVRRVLADDGGSETPAVAD